MPLLLGVVGFWGRMDRRSIFWLVALLLIAVPTVLRMLVHPPTDFFAWDADIRRVTIMHLDATGWGRCSDFKPLASCMVGKMEDGESIARCFFNPGGCCCHVLFYFGGLACVDGRTVE